MLSYTKNIIIYLINILFLTYPLVYEFHSFIYLPITNTFILQVHMQ